MGVKLTTHLHLVLRSRKPGSIHPHLHGIVLNYLSIGTTLPFTELNEKATVGKKQHMILWYVHSKPEGAAIVVSTVTIATIEQLLEVVFFMPSAEAGHVLGTETNRQSESEVVVKQDMGKR
jgi:hypothetical protein